MKALIAIGGISVFRHQNRQYQRHSTWHRNEYLVEWRYRHWSGWRPVVDARALTLEAAFCEEREERDETLADTDEVILTI